MEKPETPRLVQAQLIAYAFTLEPGEDGGACVALGDRRGQGESPLPAAKGEGAVIEAQDAVRQVPVRRGDARVDERVFI
jgi:hypothetical protein